MILCEILLVEKKKQEKKMWKNKQLQTDINLCVFFVIIIIIVILKIKVKDQAGVIHAVMSQRQDGWQGLW